MELGTTEAAIIVVAIGGFVKAIDGGIAIIKMLISRNGKNKPEPKSEALVTMETLVLAALDKKTSTDICDLRHDYIKESTDAIRADVAQLLKKTNGG